MNILLHGWEKKHGCDRCEAYGIYRISSRVEVRVSRRALTLCKIFSLVSFLVYLSKPPTYLRRCSLKRSPLTTVKKNVSKKKERRKRIICWVEVNKLENKLICHMTWRSTVNLTFPVPVNIGIEKLIAWLRDNRIIRSEVSESKCYQPVSLGFLIKAYLSAESFKRIGLITVAHVVICRKFTIQHKELI